VSELIRKQAASPPLAAVNGLVRCMRQPWSNNTQRPQQALVRRCAIFYSGAAHVALKSAHFRAWGSVQPFLHSSRLCQTDKHRHTNRQTDCVMRATSVFIGRTYMRSVLVVRLKNLSHLLSLIILLF